MDAAQIAVKSAELLPKGLELARDFLAAATARASYDFRVAHNTYCTNVALKYCRSRTFFVRDEPQFIDEFYVPASVLRSGNKRLERAGLNSLRKISRKLIVAGNGGSGKTVFMKHLIMNAIEEAVGYPVYIELRRLNDHAPGEVDLKALIVEFMRDHGFPLSDDFAQRSLNDGLLVLLLDGFDEVNVELRRPLERQVKSLASSTPCQIVVSSRPDMEVEGWDGFASTKIAPLELEEACELIERIRFDDEDVRRNFINKLRSGLFASHRYFLSNPLLLSIMLLTYGDSADIPNKFSSFYEQAYTALFQKHDALKSGYRRERRTELDIFEFARLFSAFSAITYDSRDIKFSQLDAIAYVDKATKVSGVEVDADGFLDDARRAVCLLVEDGLDISFVHRSFQEYFVARFIYSADDAMRTAYIDKIVNDEDIFVEVDSVLRILYEMSPDLVEEKYVVPALKEFFGEGGVRKLSLSSWRILVQKIFSGVAVDKRGGRSSLHYTINSHKYLSLFLFVRRTCLSRFIAGGVVSDDLAASFEGHGGRVEFSALKARDALWKDLAVNDGAFSMSEMEVVRRHLGVAESAIKARNAARKSVFSFLVDA